MLQKVPKPILIAGAALVGLVALAGLIGGNRPKPQPAEATPAQPAAAQEVPTPTPAADAAPAPSTSASTATAAPVAAGMPPALPLAAATQPGALEVVDKLPKDGQPFELARRQLDAQALGIVATAGTRESVGGAGWSTEDGAGMRVTRSGLIRVDAAGPVAFMLSRGDNRYATECAVAVGDRGNVVMQGSAAEQAASVELLPGWHRVWVSASLWRSGDATCTLATKPAGQAAPAIADLHVPAEQAATQAQPQAVRQ